MKIIIGLLVCVSALAQAQELQISGSWGQAQAIEQVAHSQSVWRFSSVQQRLELQPPPTGFKAPQVGDWLAVQMRMNPAGMMRRLSWSHTSSAEPWLVLGHNSRLSDAAVEDWRWEPSSTGTLPLLLTSTQRVTLRLNRATKVGAWCVLISDIRLAKPSSPEVASESETRFDWWAQRDVACATHRPHS